MGVCWFCEWGWPKPIMDIYEKALRLLDGDESPLEFGPARIVWSDENFDSADWCLEHFEENKGDFSDEELEIVKQSLIELKALPKEILNPEPEAYFDDNDHPWLYPPPENIIMVKKN